MRFAIGRTLLCSKAIDRIPTKAGDARACETRRARRGQTPFRDARHAPVDLDAYFLRIGYSGDRSPTLATLHAIAEAHVQSIPFENLDVLLGRGVSLLDEDVDRKLVASRRGGYCFEHNTLMLRVLAELGFAVRPLAGRARVSRPRDVTPARTHVFVHVDLDGEPFIMDVGVGGLSSTAALRFLPGVEQETPHEPRRFVYEEGRWFHQAKLGDVWADVSEFSLEEMPSIDREVANWYTSAHPLSHFRDRLMVARARPGGGRVTLLNRELTERSGEETTRRLVASPEELLEVLRLHFDLDFPDATVFPCPALVWE
jgi:N-hydroxyarylamine O-acetyltransferase